MDQETATYIVKYFSHLLTAKEKLVVVHVSATSKLESAQNPDQLALRAKEKGWITTDAEALGLLQEGYNVFERRVAERILSAHPDKDILNNCPKCGKLARTPKAMQCRHCGHNWHG